MTVNGPLNASALGVTDAHQHVWIAPVAGGPAGAPLLCDRDVIAAGLTAYRAAGGGACSTASRAAAAATAGSWPNCRG